MKKEKTEISARLPFAVSMLIFGTIGLLRRFIELPSGVIACFRGLLGCVLLLLLCGLLPCFCSGCAGKSRTGPPSGGIFCRFSSPAA